MRPLLCTALVALLFASHAAFADDTATLQPSTNQVENTIAAKGLSYGALAGFGIRLTDHGHNSDMALGAVNVSYPLTGAIGSSWYRGVLDYKVELDGGILTNFNDRGFAGLSPVGLRYNFTSAGKLVPYVEGILGLGYIDVPKTVQGTRFTFYEGAAAGVQYFVSRSWALNMQVRYMHISNAGIKEPNPGMNTGYLLVGASYY